MMRWKNMLLIGSTGSNTGKTTLACRMLERFADTYEIIGIKVTTISDRSGRCPRGGEGCGVCTSLEGDFDITEELRDDSHKDTSKLLRAGAKRVFWMRVLQDKLPQGLQALRDVIGEGSIVICESNALRTVAEPDVFVLTNSAKVDQWKTSAQWVKPYADAVVTYDAEDGFDVGRIDLGENGWGLRLEAATVILAGGKSTRMGTDKARVQIEGQTMLEHIVKQSRTGFDEILLSVASSMDVPEGCRIVVDPISGEGPLIGIVETLQASSCDVNFVRGCDLPELRSDLIRRMVRESREYDVVVPVNTDGSIEPLYAIYKKSALPVMKNAVRNGIRKIDRVYDQLRVHRIPIDRPILNLNTQQDFENYVSGQMP